ncbi:hypothetical protein Q8A73_007527 [Channa argus]|nr:hypothetical protein Q8A73_007527 [Channa argus]
MKRSSSNSVPVHSRSRLSQRPSRLFSRLFYVRSDSLTLASHKNTRRQRTDLSALSTRHGWLVPGACRPLRNGSSLPRLQWAELHRPYCGNTTTYGTCGSSGRTESVYADRFNSASGFCGL